LSRGKAFSEFTDARPKPTCTAEWETWWKNFNGRRRKPVVKARRHFVPSPFGPPSNNQADKKTPKQRYHLIVKIKSK